jgi:hypothetical protein
MAEHVVQTGLVRSAGRSACIGVATIAAARASGRPSGARRDRHRVARAETAAMCSKPVRESSSGASARAGQDRPPGRLRARPDRGGTVARAASRGPRPHRRARAPDEAGGIAPLRSARPPCPPGRGARPRGWRVPWPTPCSDRSRASPPRVTRPMRAAQRRRIEPCSSRGRALVCRGLGAGPRPARRARDAARPHPERSGPRAPLAPPRPRTARAARARPLHDRSSWQAPSRSTPFSSGSPPPWKARSARATRALVAHVERELPDALPPALVGPLEVGLHRVRPARDARDLGSRPGLSRRGRAPARGRALEPRGGCAARRRRGPRAHGAFAGRARYARAHAVAPSAARRLPSTRSADPRRPSHG